jgi:hypothetical protein
MVTIGAAIGLLIVVQLFLLRVARGRRRRPASFMLKSLGAVSPRWLNKHGQRS